MDASPDPQIRSTAFRQGILQAISLLAMCGALLYFGPKFYKVFKDFKTDLPSISKNVFYVFLLLQSYWPLALLFALVWPLVTFGVAAHSFSRSAEARTVWYAATWLVLVAALVIGIVAFLMPMLQLVQNLAH